MERKENKAFMSIDEALKVLEELDDTSITDDAMFICDDAECINKDTEAEEQINDKPVDEFYETYKTNKADRIKSYRQFAGLSEDAEIKEPLDDYALNRTACKHNCSKKKIMTEILGEDYYE